METGPLEGLKINLLLAVKEKKIILIRRLYQSLLCSILCSQCVVYSKFSKQLIIFLVNLFFKVLSTASNANFFPLG